MSPNVSVVIPCFNLGAYLDEAVQSVLEQTYADFEIVIVDDGSDDPATCHLLTSYLRPKTRIIRTENRGLAEARNGGLNEARGRYVSFLDADDAYERRFLERTVGCLQREPATAFASCWLSAFGDASFTWRPESCAFPELLAEDTVCTAALIRREVLLALGGFDPQMPLAGYEDWELAVRLVACGHQGKIIPEQLFRYRIRSGSMTEMCAAPENHALLVAYIVDKHADAYRTRSTEVMKVIEKRIQALEATLPNVPVRPDLRDTDWKGSILTLESHRRALEEMTRAGENGGDTGQRHRDRHEEEFRPK